MNTMLRKELRDAIRWAPVGLILLAALIVYTLRQPSYYYTLSNQLFSFTWLCSSGFALLLSLATFLPDERDAARAFLVHRGISLDTIFRRRVWVGLIVYALTMFAPLACTAVYLANIGPLHAPVSPWQVLPACVAVVFCSATYFAGIIVACRPSRWLGTRLLPLGAGIAVSVASIRMGWDAAGWLTLVCFLVGAIGITLVGLASRFAFTKLPTQIGRANSSSRSLPMFIVLTFSAVFVCSIVFSFPITTVSREDGLHWKIAFEEDGTPWVTTLPLWPTVTDKQTHFPRVKVTDSQNEPAADEKPTRWDNWDEHFYLKPIEPRERSWDPRCKLLVLDNFIVWDGSGYLLVYEIPDVDVIRLKSVIGRDRVTRHGEPRGLPFESVPTICGRSLPFGDNILRSVSIIPIAIRQNAKYPRLDFINEQGIYQVDLNEGKVETILDRDISLYCELPSTDEETGKFLVQSNGTTTVYRRINAADGNQSEAGDFLLEPEETIPAIGHNSGHFIWLADNRNWTRIDANYLSGILLGFHVSRSKDGNVRSFDFRMPDDIAEAIRFKNDWEAPVFFSSLPPILSSVIIATRKWMNDPFIRDWQLMFLLGQMVVAVSMAYFAARYRRLSKQRLLAWTIAGALLGVGTWLAILAIYPQVFTATCSQCKKKRWVEEISCEHCGAEWDVPSSEGIEIRDNDEWRLSVPRPASV